MFELNVVFRLYNLNTKKEIEISFNNSTFYSNVAWGGLTYDNVIIEVYLELLRELELGDILAKNKNIGYLQEYFRQNNYFVLFDFSEN